MDCARLSASRCPRFSSGQTIFLQLGRPVGRRAPPRMGSGRSALKHLSRRGSGALAQAPLQPISLATAGPLGLGLSPEPQAQAGERPWHPAVPLQKSESNWRRGLD